MKRITRSHLTVAVLLGLASAPLVPGAELSFQIFLSKSDNPHISPYASVLVGSVWPTRKLYVCWENPSSSIAKEMAEVQAAVRSTWEANSGLTFAGWLPCAAQSEGIRIFVEDSGPHTKGLGRQLDGKQRGMVLNFSFENWSPACQAERTYCIRGIAVHEFGHALGFAHEQNRFDKPGECREPAQGTTGDVNLTPYDPESVMNYCNSKYNNDGLLSKLDTSAVQYLYGSPADRTFSAMSQGGEAKKK